MIKSDGTNACRDCKRISDRMAQRRRRAKRDGKPDPLYPRPRKYIPDPNDPAVTRARNERERVREMRKLHGPEWYKHMETAA
jgi:hypothetical protein